MVELFGRKREFYKRRQREKNSCVNTSSHVNASQLMLTNAHGSKIEHILYVRTEAVNSQLPFPLEYSAITS